MSVNDADRHTWEALRHGIRGETGLVANTAVHHLIVTFRPRSSAIVLPVYLIRFGNKGWEGAISPSDALGLRNRLHIQRDPRVVVLGYVIEDSRLLP